MAKWVSLIQILEKFSIPPNPPMIGGNNKRKELNNNTWQ